MSNQTPTLDDDYLDGCLADLDFDPEPDDLLELRVLFPEGERSVIAESEWRALFREEDLDDLEGRYLTILAEEALRGSGAYSGTGRDLGIAARLRAMGLKVVEVAGWQTRGLATFNPKLSVDHHTASAIGSNAPALNICINGRSDLPGPLCHVLIARDNTCYVIASGKANHAGLGGYFGVTGNSNCYGVERENNGTTERWREDQRVTAAKVHAALLSALRPEYQRVCEHKEWAPDRKIDAWDQSGADMRNRVAAALKPVAPTPDEPDQEEDDMPKPQLFRFGPSRQFLYQDVNRNIRLVSAAALPGYKIQQQLDGASPDVCTLATRHADGTWTHDDPNIVTWTKAVISMPFVGPMPAGWDQWWIGPCYPEDAVLSEQIHDLVEALPAKIVSLLPPAAVGGLSMEDVKAGCTQALKETLGPVFDQIV